MRGEDALAQFDEALNAHTANVHAAFNRVFGDRRASSAQPPVPRAALIHDVTHDPEAASIRFAAGVFAKHAAERATRVPQRSPEIIRAEAEQSINPRRALAFVTRVAGSLDKNTKPLTINESELRALVRVCGVSEFFGEMLAGNPALIQVLPVEDNAFQTPIDLCEFISTDSDRSTFAASLETLRHGWSRLFVEIGARDSQGAIAIEELNLRLNTLAVSSLDASLLIARNELERRYGKLSAEPRVAVLGLGRLGSGGMDYGSDLDVIVVYDSNTPPPVAELTHEAVYSRLAEFLVTALSIITREGYLYRIDLRLRPEGQKGPLAIGSRCVHELSAHAGEHLGVAGLCETSRGSR